VALLLKEVSMSRSRVIIGLAAMSILLIATVRFAAAWFPITDWVPSLPPTVPAFNITAVPSAPVAVVEKTQTNKSKGAPAKAEPAKRTMLSAAAGLPSGPLPVAEAPSAAQEVPAVPFPQSAGRDPLRVGANAQESKLIYRVGPEYPELAKRARISGNVVLVVTVNEEGLVSEVRVVNGHPLLNEAAISAVKQWRYSPTLLNGVPVPVMATVTVIFNFSDGQNPFFILDPSGELKTGGSASVEDLISKMGPGGRANINILAGTPIRTAEYVIQGLMQRGVQNIQVGGTYTLYQGRLFYTGKTTNPTSIQLSDALAARAMIPPDRSGNGPIKIYGFNLFINEIGEIVGVQRLFVGTAAAGGGLMFVQPTTIRRDGSTAQPVAAGGGLVMSQPNETPVDPEIEQELMRSRVISPGMLGSDPVSVVYQIQFSIRQ
jgi:TonB family protein